jgi:hypothetical protein
VFIGRHLDRAVLQRGFLDCVHEISCHPVAQPVL